MSLIITVEGPMNRFLEVGGGNVHRSSKAVEIDTFEKGHGGGINWLRFGGRGTSG